MRARAARLVAGQAGAALLEFALILPVFLTMLMGLVAYGGYFWRSSSLQGVANDSARASLSGLTAAERQALALASVTAQLPGSGIDPTRVTTTVTQPSGTVMVRLSYDGSRDGFLKLGVVPMPSSTIQRVAAVRLGGL